TPPPSLLTSHAPLVCTWQTPSDSVYSCFVLSGTTGGMELILTGVGTELLCREAGTGKEKWHTHVAFAPSWAASHAGLVLVGGDRGVNCLRDDTGRLVWGLPMRQGERLSAFQLAAGRLFCLIDERRLLAVDAERGWPLWERWAPGAPW